MKNILSFVILLSVILTGSTLFSQNIKNTDYKFSINPGSDWKQRNVVETNKKDVITYSFDKKDGRQSISLIAFKLNAPKKIDDYIYTIEKDFNLNIPEKSGNYSDFTGSNFEGKAADYGDKESIERIYFAATTTPDANGLFYCYMIRFVGDGKLARDIFTGDVKMVAETFKVEL